jgi:PAS domain S-box-containing protein
VVDNDLVSRTAVGNALRNAGLKPVTFGNPDQALDHLKSNPADLVIVDASVSDRAGLELRNQVSEIEGHKNTPVLVVATPRGIKHATRKPSKNATEFVAKPYTPMELSLKALSTVLKNRAPSKPAPAPPSSAPPPIPPANAPVASTAVSRAPQRPVHTQPHSQITDVPEVFFKKAPSPQPGSSQPASPSPQLSGAEDAVIEFNDAYKIVSANNPCSTFFGWQIQEMVGRDLASVLKGGLNNDLGRFVQQGDAAVRGSGQPSVDVIVCRKDGTEVPSVVTLEPVLQGSQLSWTASFRAATGVAGAPPYTAGPAPDSYHAPAQSPALAEALRRLQQSQASLQSANEELHKQFEAISSQATTQREEIERKEKERSELVARIYSNELEISRVKTTLERETEERKKAEESVKALTTAKSEIENQLAEETQSKEGLLQSCHQFRGQLDDAKLAAERIEAALKQETERARRFEQESASLKQAHEEVNRKFSAEQQAAAEAGRKAGEFDNRIREQSGEIERVKSELEKQTAAWNQKETEWREQMAAAKAAGEKAEAAWMEEAERAGRFEKALAGLRRERDEIQAGRAGDQEAAQRAAAESKRQADEFEARLRESAAELERVKAEFQKQSADRGTSETDLRGQLDAAKSGAEKIEAAFKDEAGRCIRLEAEITGLQRVRDELNGQQVAAQRTMAELQQRYHDLESRLRERTEELECVKAELHRHTAERGGLESDLRAQLDAARASAEETAIVKRRLEEELAGLKQNREELQNRLDNEQQTGAKSKRRIKELEKHLRDSANGFATARAELQKRLAERERLEQELRAEFDAAKAARAEETGRSARLEGELSGLRELHEELNSRWKCEQQTVAELKLHNDDIEKRLREGVAELGRAKATIENHAAERARLESSQQSVVGVQEELGTQLCHLRETEAGYKAELSELERRIRDGVASLARATADLEKERGERRRTEQRAATLAAQLQELHGELRLHLESEKETRARLADFEQQLHERDNAMARVSADLNKESAERQLAEEQLRAAGDMSAQLRKYLSLFEESKKVFKRTQDDLESRLQASLEASSGHDSKLQKEITERQRLEEAIGAAQRDLNEQSQKSALELAKLQSALQVEEFERKRLEGDAVQSRFAALDSARVGRTLVNSLRREIRQPIETLLRSTRQLLEVELQEQEKKLLESVLENALLVQTTLQETTTLNAGGTARPGLEGSGDANDARSSAPATGQPASDLQP